MAGSRAAGVVLASWLWLYLLTLLSVLGFTLVESGFVSEVDLEFDSSPGSLSGPGTENKLDPPERLEAAFPGPWDRYIKAPKDKQRVVPRRVWRVRGNVSSLGLGDSFEDGETREMEDGEAWVQGKGILIGMGGQLTVEFDENIGGRCVLSLVPYR